MTDNHTYTQSKLWHLEFLSEESRLKWVQIAILLFVGLFAFFHNLGLSLLEGTEGLYAHVTHELVRSEQFLLTYLGQQYTYKPPAFFWLLAGSTTLFGEHEVALRLPGALFSLGTMVMTYYLGKMLFSRTAGFWAALVAATVYVTLWYGRRVLIDSTLTFCMTLAVFAWLRAYLQIGSSRWYVVSFLAMALGTIVKSVHAFALPFLLLVTFSLLMRDLRPFKSVWFWAGVAVFIGLYEWYASAVGSQFAYLFSIKAGLIRMFGGGGQGPYRPDHPFYWYLTIMWFVFFPWCALIPSSLVLLAQRRPFRDYPREGFVLLWVLGYLLMFSIVQMNREPYLMPVLPGLGLMVGYYYQTAFSTSEPQRMATPLLKLTLTLLAVAFAVAFYIGPSLLHRNWSVPLSLFPTPFIIVILCICALLVYNVMRSWTREALLTLGVLAVGFTIAVVQIILPAIDQAASPRLAADSIKSVATTTKTSVHLYRPVRLSNEDLVYYLTVEPALPVITTEKSLVDRAQQEDSVLIVTDRDRFTNLSQKPDFLIAPVREFQQPRNKNYFLLSIKARDRAGAGSKG